MIKSLIDLRCGGDLQHAMVGNYSCIIDFMSGAATHICDDVINEIVREFNIDRITIITILGLVYGRRTNKDIINHILVEEGIQIDSRLINQVVTDFIERHHLNGFFQFLKDKYYISDLSVFFRLITDTRGITIPERLLATKKGAVKLREYISSFFRELLAI